MTKSFTLVRELLYFLLLSRSVVIIPHFPTNFGYSVFVTLPAISLPSVSHTLVGELAGFCTPAYAFV